MKKIILFLGFLWWNVIGAVGQEWVFQADKGFIIKHSATVGHLVTTHPNSYQISYQQRYTGTQEWHKHYKYPKISYDFTFFDYHNLIIGNTYALTINTHLPFFNVRKRKQLDFKLGTGLVYCSNPFNLETNTKNVFLSQRVSSVMAAGAIFSYQVFPRWRFLAGLQLTHYSNGSSTLPNNGINIVSTTFGVGFRPSSKPIEYLTPQKTSYITIHKGTFGFQASLAGSRVVATVGQASRYTIVALGLYGTYQVSKISTLNAGIDISWSERVKRQIERTYIDSSSHTSRPDYRRVGVVVGNEVAFGRVSLLMQVGIYAYKQFQAKNEMAFYQRYGVRYYATPNLFLGVLLKSHANNAECLEWIAGFRFGKKRLTPK